jgi:hypothetical protein
MAFNLADTYRSFLGCHHSDSQKIRSEKRNKEIINLLSQNWLPDQFCGELPNQRSFGAGSKKQKVINNQDSKYCFSVCE